MSTQHEPPIFISTGSRDSESIRFLNNLFERAAQEGVSDVHIEDGDDGARIRVRINGAAVEWYAITRQVSTEVNTKLRMRAKMPLMEQRSPLDGRFRLSYTSGVEVDIRMSMLPTIYGYSTVCRILDQRNTARKLSSLYMAEPVRECISEILNEPSGLFLVTGPTGSGKTSTLYAIINELNTSDRKILTIEDPVEYRVNSICQTNIEPGVTFASALRAAMRQDPDVILVGEIRDHETAIIAVQAAMTGHLVLSTLHANDAPSTALRLLELGVDPGTLGASLRAVLAQRLVRGISEDARDMQPPSEVDRVWLEMQGISLPDVNFAVPMDGYGYKGRVPVMEMMTIDKQMRQAFSSRDPRWVRNAARKQPQFQTLAEAGAVMASLGLTSLSEIRTITSNGEKSSNGQRKLGERLVEFGLLTDFQLEQAIAIQKEYAGKGDYRQMGEILVMSKFCRQDDIDDALSSR